MCWKHFKTSSKSVHAWRLLFLMVITQKTESNYNHLPPLTLPLLQHSYKHRQQTEDTHMNMHRTALELIICEEPSFHSAQEELVWYQIQVTFNSSGPARLHLGQYLHLGSDNLRTDLTGGQFSLHNTHLSLSLSLCQWSAGWRHFCRHLPPKHSPLIAQMIDIIMTSTVLIIQIKHL